MGAHKKDELRSSVRPSMQRSKRQEWHARGNRCDAQCMVSNLCGERQNATQHDEGTKQLEAFQALLEMPHSDVPLKIRPPPGLEMMPLSFDRAGSAHGFDVLNAFIAAEDPAYVHCAIDYAES